MLKDEQKLSTLLKQVFSHIFQTLRDENTERNDSLSTYQ